MCSTIVGRYNLMTANFNHQNDYMHKGIKIGIIGAIVIIVGASAFYLASPLFISTEIDEPLPEGCMLDVKHVGILGRCPGLVAYEFDIVSAK